MDRTPDIIGAESRHARMERIEGNSAPIQKVDHHDHGGTTLGTIAIILASLAIGGLAVYIVMAQVLRAQERDAHQVESALRVQLTEAQIRAGVAEAEASSARARVDSRVALDEVERMRTDLASKGIVVKKDH